jgi:hypothetical protein
MNELDFGDCGVLVSSVCLFSIMNSASGAFSIEFCVP